MTPEQRTRFNGLLSEVINAAITGEPYERQLAHEDHLRNYVSGLLEDKDTEITVPKGLTFAESIDDDILLDPITEEFLSAMDEAYANGDTVGLLRIIRRWRDGELIVPQAARLIDECEWPLPGRLNRAHKAYMLQWEGPAYEGRHAQKPVKPSTNWVYHVDFYHDGSVGIDRHHGKSTRIYYPTATSLRRLENIINALSWSWWPPTKLDPIHVILKNRAVAPMRHYK